MNLKTTWSTDLRTAKATQKNNVSAPLPLNKPLKCIGVRSKSFYLGQWFSTYLTLQPFNTILVSVTPNNKIIYCYFITVILLLL